MIATPQFWTTLGWQSKALQPISWAYGAIAGGRMTASPRYRANVPVVAIGNFTAGGAGKTPTAVTLTQIAIEMGFSPIVLMRGYGGATRGPVLIDPNHDSSLQVGDEALMIARAGVPVVVARDRAAGAAHAISCGSDLILLDDGFQSPALAKDIAIVVVDSVYGIGNGQIIPAGPLRAPLGLQIAAMDALVVVSNGIDGSAANGLVDLATQAGKPVFTAQVEADTASADFRGKHVVAFAGIGRPAKLAEGLTARGAIVDDLVAFPDHHRYTPREARALLQRVQGTDRVLVTTSKDMARLIGEPDPAIAALAARVEVAAVKLVFERPGNVRRFLAQRLTELGMSARPTASPDALIV